MTKITIEKGQLHLSNTVIKRKFECDIKIRLRDLYFRLYLCIYEIISIEKKWLKFFFQNILYKFNPPSATMSGGEGRLGHVITNPEGELPPPATAPDSPRRPKQVSLLQRPCMYLAW